MTRRHGRGTGEQGQALLELALITPVLVLIIAGLIQFGIIFERQIGINNAIRDAARIAATWESKDTASAGTNAGYALAKVRSLLGNAQSYEEGRMRIEVCIGTPSANAVDPANNHQVDVRIKVWYRHPLFLPIVDVLLDGIDGANDQSLEASNVTEFHVEQSGDNNVAVAGVSSYPAGVASCSM